MSPALAGRFFTAEPQGKPGNYIAAFQKPSGHQAISASLEIFLCRKKASFALGCSCINSWLDKSEVPCPVVLAGDDDDNT